MAKASFRPKGLLTPNPKAPLREQVREVLRFHHYSLRTEKAYWQWIRRFILFHRRKLGDGSSEMGVGKDQSRLTSAATEAKGWVWRHPKEM